MTTKFVVNGKAASTDEPPATPLLWVIREGLKLTGTKFGCGTGLCGACMVHIDGKRAYSCQTQVLMSLNWAGFFKSSGLIAGGTVGFSTV